MAIYLYILSIIFLGTCTLHHLGIELLFTNMYWVLSSSMCIPSDNPISNSFSIHTKRPDHKSYNQITLLLAISIHHITSHGQMFWFKLHEGYQASRWDCVIENHFSYFSTQTYIVGAQKNRLNEMILLGTQNILLNWCQSTLKVLCLSGPMENGKNVDGKLYHVDL